MSAIFELELGNEIIKKPEKFISYDEPDNKVESININYKSNPEYYNVKFKYLSKLNISMPTIKIFVEKNKSEPIPIQKKKENNNNKFYYEFP
jgi:hypothetical protein